MAITYLEEHHPVLEDCMSPLKKLLDHLEVEICESVKAGTTTPKDNDDNDSVLISSVTVGEVAPEEQYYMLINEQLVQIAPSSDIDEGSYIPDFSDSNQGDQMILTSVSTNDEISKLIVEMTQSAPGDTNETHPTIMCHKPEQYAPCQ